MWKIAPQLYLQKTDNVSRFPLLIRFKSKPPQKLLTVDEVNTYLSKIEKRFEISIKNKELKFKDLIYTYQDKHYRIRKYDGTRTSDLYLMHQIPRIEHKESWGIRGDKYFTPDVKDFSQHFELIGVNEINHRISNGVNSSDDKRNKYLGFISLIESEGTKVEEEEKTINELIDENSREIQAIFWGDDNNNPELITTSQNELQYEDIARFNESSIKNRKSFNECILISMDTLTKLIYMCRRNHPMESCSELKFFTNISIQNDSWNLFKKTFGHLYPKKNKKICGDIIFENVGSPIKVEGVEASRVTRSYETYDVYETYTYYDIDFHSHVFPLQDMSDIPSTLSDADVKKTKMCNGGGLLINYPYTLESMIAWSKEGYGKNIFLCNEEGDIID